MCLGIPFPRSLAGIIGGVPSLKALQGASNDDWVDRINHVWTVFLFALFAIVVSTGQFVGAPIHCWCPAEFTDFYVGKFLAMLIGWLIFTIAYGLKYINVL